MLRNPCRRMPGRARWRHLAHMIRRLEFRIRSDPAPLAPIAPKAIGVCQPANVEVTLSTRKNSPLPERETEHEIVSRLWAGHFAFAMSDLTKAFCRFQWYRTTIFMPTFKALLTLLELPLPSLHDETIAGVTQSVDRYGGIRNGKRGVAWPALRGRDHRLRHGGDRHRRGRHGRRRGLHQPGLSGQGHPLGLFHSVVMDGRRHCRAMRRVFLQRTRRDVSALERRIQFPDPRLSS